MDDLPNESCELRIIEGWEPISLADALLLAPSRVKRCPVCHGRLRAHQADSDGMAAHFEHFELHLGCYLADAFDGNPRPHRKALK
jgi:hypothetical protein